MLAIERKEIYNNVWIVLNFVSRRIMTETSETRISELLKEDSPLNEALTILLNKKAQDIILYDLRNLSQLFDFVVVATGLSSTQIGVIKRSLERGLRKLGTRPLGAEGEPDSGWVLIDYNDFVIHVMEPSKRDYYRLDKLWGDQPSEMVADNEDIGQDKPVS